MLRNKVVQKFRNSGILKVIFISLLAYEKISDDFSGLFVIDFLLEEIFHTASPLKVHFFGRVKATIVDTLTKMDD